MPNLRRSALPLALFAPRRARRASPSVKGEAIEWLLDVLRAAILSATASGGVRWKCVVIRSPDFWSALRVM
jgi:hypothetical protein